MKEQESKKSYFEINKSLIEKNFILLMLGKLVSLVGSRLQSFALSLYVLAQTGSTVKFASVLAVTMLPNLILGPFIGVFVDWLDRKKMIVYLDLISGILTGIAAWIFYRQGELSLPFIYGLTIAFSVISMLFNPAIRTIIPSIVKKEQLLEANAVNTFVLNLGQFIAPVLAGMIYGLYGLGPILTINAVSFVLSAISEMFISIPISHVKSKHMTFNNYRSDFVEGIRYVRKDPTVFGIINMATVLNFFFNPIMAIGLIFVTKEVLRISDIEYGYMQSVIVVGMLLAPIICTKLAKRFSIGHLLYRTLMIVSLLLAAFAATSTLWFLNIVGDNAQVAFWAITGIAALIAFVVSIGNIALGSLIQQSVPNSHLGRVDTIMGSITTAAIPVGQMVFGFMFAHFSPFLSIGTSALAIAACVQLNYSMLSKQDTEKVTQTGIVA